MATPNSDASRGVGSSSTPPATVYTVADSAFFPGAVAVINSLRVTGFDGEVVVVDLGLCEDQRALLREHVQVVTAHGELTGNPLLHKPFPALLDPHGTVVIIDSDMIVTRPLDDVLAEASSGRICLLSDESQDERWFEQWQERFGLRAPLRRESYVNSGFVAFSVDHHPHLLSRWWTTTQSIRAEETRAHGAPWEHPCWDGDQDALNALLMSEVPAGTVRTWPQHVTDVMLRVRIEDPLTLRCTDGGAPVTVLHHTGSPKPWRRQAWMRVRRNCYVRLMPRLLFSPDVPLQVPGQAVPYWLRSGYSNKALLLLLSVANGLGRRIVRRAGGRTRQVLRRIRNVLAGERASS